MFKKLLGIAVALSFSSSVNSAIIIDQQFTAGATNVYVGSVCALQSFVPAMSGSLESVDLQVNSTGVNNGTLDVFSGTPGTGTLLASVTVPCPTGTNWVKFKFANCGVNITSGGNYYVRLSGALNWLRSTSGNYAGGMMYQCPSSSFPTSDLNFKTYMIGGTCTNPVAGANQTNVQPNTASASLGVNANGEAGKWTTSGTGTFSSGNDPLATYTPSCGDAGTTVTLTWTSCCNNAISTQTISVPANTINCSNVTICAGQTATLTASGNYTSVSWNTGATTSTFVTAPLSSTTVYTVTGTYSSGCTKAYSPTVTVNQLPVVSITKTNVSCNGGVNGSATANASVAPAPYTYSWSPSGGSGTTATGLSAGNYTVMVTSQPTGCAASQTITITQPTALSGTTSASNVTCNGLANGSATITASGGTSPYTYSWAPSGGTSATASSLAPATYTCTITDNNGCVATRTVTITQPAALTSTLVSTTNVACFGGSNGAASISASGGTAAYSYNWTPGNPTGDGTANASGLTAGSWTCTVTDANGCTTSTVASISQPSAIATSISSQTNVACNGGTNGAAIISSSGGTGAHTYDWTPGNPTGDGTTSVTGLSAGSWTCTVTDANACTASQVVTITQPSAISSSVATLTNVSCFGGSNGAASLTVSGGTPGYTYSWSPSGGTSSSISGRTAGTYTCTITDANGCNGTRTLTITQPPALGASLTSSSNVSCNLGSNGSASVTVSGGTPAYSYNWTPGNPAGDGTSSVTGLSAGNWTCTVTDANACTTIQTVTISQPSAIAVSTSQSNILCNGASTGSAAVSVTGGTGAYSYSWSPVGGSSSSASGLSAGAYTCTVTDANSCTGYGFFTITEPSALNATTTSGNVNCNGGSDGSASVSVTGGTGGYSYSWSPAGGNAASASGLSVGSYTVLITDANACSISRTFNITQPSTLSATSSRNNVSCFGLSDGDATVTVNGGTIPYAYSWAPAGGTGATATALPAGSYTCTITDANSCQITKTVNITQPAALVATTSTSDVTCNGSANGIAAVSTSGGTLPYSYVWSPGGSTAAMITNLAPGSYTCDITDANGCIQQKTVSISEPSALNATSSHVNVSCNGLSDGSAVVTAFGGTGPYQYSWSPSGGAAASATSLSAGNYTCTITDNNNCTTTSVVVVSQPATLSVAGTSTSVSCNGGANGTIATTVTGGTGAYSYSWTPNVSTSASASSLPAATYTVLVTDANNCNAQSTITVGQPAALSASSSHTNVSCNGASNGTATVNVTGGTTTYSYSWSPSGGTSATAGGLASGSYTCTITDANNCSIQKVETVGAPASLTVVGTQANVSCNGSATGIATVSVSGGTPSYTYSWSPVGGSGSSATGLSAGVYTCTITDANGCSAAKIFVITEPSALSASGVSTNATCFNGTNGSASVAVSGGTPGYTYLWTPAGGTTANANNLSAGNYTCAITDVKGCTTAQTFVISQPASGVTIAVSTSPAACNSHNGSATASVTGGSSPYIYQWSSGSNSAIADSLSAGQYFLQVYDAAGCYSTKVVTVNNTNAPVVALNSLTNVNCNGGNTGSISVNVTGGSAPYTYLWSNGTNTASNTSLQAGPYEVTVTDVNNCTVSQTFTITQPITLSATFNTTPATCGASDGSAGVSISGGTAPYTYAWSANAGGQTSSTATSLSSGIYSVVATDVNGCSITSQGMVNSANSTLAVAIDTVVQGGCSSGSSGSIEITAGGGTLPYSFAWNNGATTEDVYGLAPGTYMVLVTDSNNCTASQTVTVASSMQGYQPEICLVTVDTTTLTNLVVWEKTLTEGIHSYKVHRETSSPGVYQVVGTVPYDSLSQFTDAVANPQVRSWRYKISAVDSCGVETPKSQPHKTIHLAQNLGFGGTWNLAWDYYDGFGYSTYFIWRHDPSTGWMKIDSLPVTLTSYSDLSPPSINSRYMIEILPISACNPTRGAINTSRSNIKVSTVGGTTGIADATNNWQLSVFPNPSTDLINVHFDQKTKEKITVRIVDALGRSVIEKTYDAASVREALSLEGISSGLYLLEVRTLSGVKQVKIIKQ